MRLKSGVGSIPKTRLKVFSSGVGGGKREMACQISQPRGWKNTVDSFKKEILSTRTV